MAKYLTGEVEKLTGVKANVLRSWGTAFPGFSPQKDISGKRLYSQRELDTIVRLKHLIYAKSMTVEDARRQLVLDAAAAEAKAASLATLREIRAQLAELYLLLKKTGEYYHRKRQEGTNGRNAKDSEHRA